MIKTFMAVAAALAMLTLAVAARADIYLEEEQRVSGVIGVPPQVTMIKSWYKGKKLKQSIEGMDQVWIVDYGTQQLMALQPRSGTYWIAPLEGYRAVLQTALQFWGIQRKPDGAVYVPADLFKPTGQKRKIGGWNAYEVKLPVPAGTKGKMSMWISSEAGVTTNDMVTTLRVALMAGEGDELKAFFDRLMTLDGYPVLTTAETDMNGQRLVITKELKKARRLSISDDEFTVPKGFRKIEAPRFGAGAAGAPTGGGGAGGK